jgi:hypothetical protein
MFGLGGPWPSLRSPTLVPHLPRRNDPTGPGRAGCSPAHAGASVQGPAQPRPWVASLAAGSGLPCPARLDDEVKAEALRASVA